jgi:predicted RNA-binding Zn-ribbon protein involved in translation (DUF1610 family)
MGWMLNMIRFAKKYPFKCPKCGSSCGAFRSRGHGMEICCQDCGASSPMTKEMIEELTSPSPALEDKSEP